MKQVVGCWRVSSHCHHPNISFEAQINKSLPTWFWGPNQKTVVVILGPKLPNRQPRFWSPNQETITVVLRPNHRQTIAISFEAKVENPHFSSPPRVWCGSYTASTDLLIIGPPSTQLVPDHPWPSAPSLLLLPRSSSLPAMSHSCFSTPNNWVSSTKMHRIQIQTRISQLIITHINQGIDCLVSQSPPWGVHWQLQVHKVRILNLRPIEAQLNDQTPMTNSKIVI
jgi:hypothetical protein